MDASPAVVFELFKCRDHVLFITESNLGEGFIPFQQPTIARHPMRCSDGGLPWLMPHNSPQRPSAGTLPVMLSQSRQQELTELIRTHS